MTLLHELRVARRTLAKGPGFLTLAILTLTLGIGAATILFSVTESVLWRPLPFPDSERLVVVYEQNLKRTGEGGSVSALNFRDWRDRIQTIQGLAATTWGESHNLTGRGIGERVQAKSVSSGFFETLRVQPELGRTFRRDEEEAGGRGSVILSHDFWQRHSAASPAVLGQTLKLDGEPLTVVGILPASFHLEFVDDADVFLPLNLTGADLRRDTRELVVAGRIKPGVTLRQAGGEVDMLARGLAAEYPKANANWGASVENLREHFTRSYRRDLYLYLGFAGLVLLIACANVAGLLLVRFVGRQKEFALRTALGASRASLLRQMVAETAWIAIPGGIGGALLASWGVVGIRSVLPASTFVRTEQISMDLRALAFVLAVSVVSTLGFALLPALMASKLNLDAALRDWGKSVAAGPRASRRINQSIAAEVTLAFVLLFGAGLFLSSHERLHQVRLGFNPRDILTMRISPGSKPGSNSREMLAFYRQVLRKAEGVAGVERAALASALPLTGTRSVYFAAADKPRPAHGEEPRSLARVVSPGYFRVMDIPLLSGRPFADQDSEGAPRVAIVNENLAHRVFGTENPVGKELTVLAGGDPSIPTGTVEIVGLASNTKEAGLDEIAFNDLYFPFAQAPQRAMTLAAKTAAPAGSIVSAMRHDLQALDPEGALYSLATMEERISQSLVGERFNLMLVSLFAGLAVVLAAVGIYGAISFSVAQRTREFGLRMALGARPGNLLGLTLTRMARLVLSGAGCGLILALVLGAWLKKALYLAPGEHGGLLYGVGVHDPASIAGAVGIVLGLAVLAGLAPACRAARADPLAALRHE
ncbi:MAG TPA: ABC transporter permease [Bryobacteraceae bacterium]|jgi:putative ABC transport system permease protein|nr:ABC transporter permease [Bryobacteraceae bacterium]